MYLIFPPEFSGLADAVFTQAQVEYQYPLKVRDEGLNEGLMNSSTLSVVTYDREVARNEDDVSEYRWSILKAMGQGAVFVNYQDVDEAHFYNVDESHSTEEQVKAILVAGRYAEARAKYFSDTSPKTLYVGPTYVNPLALVVTSYDAKGFGFDVDYDAKVPNVLASLPEDLWTKTAFATSRMSATLHHLLDVLPETAIVTLDKRTSKKVESYTYDQVSAPKKIDLEFGIEVRNTVKRKEVEEEG